MNIEEQISDAQAQIETARRHMQDAEAKLTELKEQFSEKENRWLIKRGEDYFLLSHSSEVHGYRNVGLKAQTEESLIGNVFKAQKEAKDHRRWLEIDTEIRRFARDYNGDYVFDLTDNQPKYIIFYDARNDKMRIHEWYNNKFIGPYFKDKLFLQPLYALVLDQDIKFWIAYNKPIYDLE